MAFWCTHRDGYSVIAFPAELSMAHMEEVREAGLKIIEQLATVKNPACIVDLSALDYMGSSLVASIVRIWKTVKAQDGKMVVVASNEKIRDVLKATGLAKVWTIVNTFEAGVHSLGYSPEAKVEKRESRMLTFVGPIALIGAGVAVAAKLLPKHIPLGIPPEWMIHTLGGLAFLASLISSFREQRLKRILSIAVFLMSIGLLGTYIWMSTSQVSPEESPAPVTPTVGVPDSVTVSDDSVIDNNKKVPDEADTKKANTENNVLKLQTNGPPAAAPEPTNEGKAAEPSAPPSPQATPGADASSSNSPSLPSSPNPEPQPAPADSPAQESSPENPPSPVPQSKAE